jgi:subtilisin family serine protease
MYRKQSTVFALVIVAALALGACQERAAPTDVSGQQMLASNAASLESSGRYVVVFSAERVPADFGARVAQLGGSIENALDSIGVVTVTGLPEAAAAELSATADVRAVESDAITTPQGGEAAEDLPEQAANEIVAVADAIASPTAAQFYPRQWNLRAVFAPEAWATGHLGSRDVKVAILDTGIDYLHPDLLGLVDLEHSKSFVPEDVMPARYADRLPFSDLFWHGTAVASVVASNAKVLAGLNQFVTLLAVKVADSTNNHTVGRLISGIVYAADQGADVINVSRGSERHKSQSPGTIAAFERAVNYAFRKGALLTSVPFNDAADLDHDGDRVRFPCEAANALCVAATGPTGASGVNGPWENVDAPAPYSAFGRSAVDVAAPGGTGDVGQFRRFWGLCTTTPTMSTVPPACRPPAAGGFCRPAVSPCIVQGAGTSFAAPTVAGLAALLVAQLGHGRPALIRERILQSADDLGQPGTDPYYGKGRINIARALGLIN